jgi:hypothetical protein
MQRHKQRGQHQVIASRITPGVQFAFIFGTAEYMQESLCLTGR